MEDFVPYEIVLKLEKMGYKGKTIRYHGHIYDVLKWLRKEKRIFIQILFIDATTYYYEVIDVLKEQIKCSSGDYKESPEQAAFAGIEYILYNNLI